jgi:hypothetical protein
VAFKLNDGGWKATEKPHNGGKNDNYLIHNSLPTRFKNRFFSFNVPSLPKESILSEG